jgi:hypothetical protein
MKFDWDAAKAKANLAKHGVSFEQAQEVFESPVIFEDFAHSERESRYIAIGFSSKGRLLAVACTRLEAGMYRIISARKATRKEQERYAKAKREADEGQIGAR